MRLFLNLSESLLLILLYLLNMQFQLLLNSYVLPNICLEFDEHFFIPSHFFINLDFFLGISQWCLTCGWQQLTFYFVEKFCLPTSFFVADFFFQALSFLLELGFSQSFLLVPIALKLLKFFKPHVHEYFNWLFDVVDYINRIDSAELVSLFFHSLIIHSLDLLLGPNFNVQIQLNNGFSDHFGRWFLLRIKLIIATYVMIEPRIILIINNLTWFNFWIVVARFAFLSIINHLLCYLNISTIMLVRVFLH